MIPVIGYIAIQGISFVFQFFINNKENSLKNLQKKHKVKIEELKNITNFNKTNELINKYGDEKPPKNQVQEGANKGQQRIRNRKDNSKSIRQQALKELNLPEQQQTQQEIQELLDNTWKSKSHSRWAYSFPNCSSTASSKNFPGQNIGYIDWIR